MPFYSVLPDTTRYPAFTQIERPPSLVDDEGAPRTPSMTRARVESLPELVEAAGLLVERRLTYEDALTGYFPRLLAADDGDRSQLFSFDAIHWSYV